MAKPDDASRTRKRAKAWLAYYTISIAEISLAFVILFILQPYLYDLNALMGSSIGLQINYILLFVLIAVVFIAWYIAAMVVCSRHLSRNEPATPRRASVMMSILMLAGWNVIYVILADAAGEEIFIVLRFFEGISFYVYLVLNGIMFLFLVKLLPMIVRHARGYARFTRKKRIVTISALCLIASSYAVAIILPFVATPPTITDDPLPPKPLLIGHRGASDYAPENTIVAAQESLQFGVVGWEIDVQVSYDGVLFLMHDDDLQRTTDVETIYPSLASLPACQFNFSQIQALDAGSWFIDNDPYSTIAMGIVPRSKAESYRGTPIPTLQQAIDFSEANNMILEIDLKSPPHGHPFHDTVRAMMLSNMTTSSLGKRAWVYTASADAVNLTRLCTYNCSVESVLAKGYDMVNTDVNIPNSQLRDFYAHGIPTILYTVDNVETFFTLWTLGVTYVKTNRPWLFTSLVQPVPRMDIAQHAMFWMIFWIIGCTVVLLTLYLKSRGIFMNLVKSGGSRTTRAKSMQ
nr:glycerophosphodiester phosphodiesterase family protein [Candidatus Sigynarchaeota archaeon]